MMRRGGRSPEGNRYVVSNTSEEKQ
jgi:hypothetical protein